MTSGGAVFDICIVGYGPVGATLAGLLAMAGKSVVVLEREPLPYPLPRAVHFDDEVMRILQTLGVADAMLPHTHVSPGMRFVDAEGRLLLDWSRPMEIGPQGWHSSFRFHQPDMEAILRANVGARPEVDVRLGAQVTALAQCADAVTITYPQGEVRARYVVGCDGARSFVRQAMGTGMEDLGFDERWVVVDAVLKRPRPDLGDYSLQHCNPARPATYVRGVNDRRRWEIALKPDEDPDVMTTPAEIWQLLAPWINRDDADLERAVCYMFRSMIADNWRQGRLLLAGDAAHLTPPFLGQGLCAGMRDAANLAWKLAAVLDGADANLLDTYQSERRPHVHEYIALAVRLGGLINTTNPAAALAQWERDDGQPARMQSIKPRLGPGLAAGDTTLTGTVAPQPWLSDGRRLDDAAGPGFALLARPDFLPPNPEPWLTVIADAAVQGWLNEHTIGAALIRPDRIILGAAKTVAQRDALLAAIRPILQVGKIAV